MDSTIVAGDGEAAGFVTSVETELTVALGFRPYPGTLNVDRLKELDDLSRKVVTASGLVTDHCDGIVLHPCSIAGVRGAVIRPRMESYLEGKTELVSPVHLRSLFDLDVGDEVAVSTPDDAWHPNGGVVDPSDLDEFDAVVFDLDGTLVDLDVSWPQVHSEIENVMGDELDRPLKEYTRPEVMGIARETGHYEEIDQLLTEHETDGVESSPKLSLLDTLDDLDCPVGVCTANARSATVRALERHGAYDAVDAIVARGTVEEEKPHPRPLQRCLESLDAMAGNAVFIGDERADTETAVAAGTSFLHPQQLE